MLVPVVAGGVFARVGFHEVVDRVVQVIGHAFVDGEPVVRLVFLDPTLPRERIDAFFEALLLTAEEGELPEVSR